MFLRYMGTEIGGETEEHLHPVKTGFNWYVLIILLLIPISIIFPDVGNLVQVFFVPLLMLFTILRFILPFVIIVVILFVSIRFLKARNSNGFGTNRKEGGLLCRAQEIRDPQNIRRLLGRLLL